MFKKFDGCAINHIAFSYPDIEPVYKRPQSKGVEIVKGIAWDEKLKMKSFFVRAPDNVLVEIVEAAPLPEASWLDHVHYQSGEDSCHIFQIQECAKSSSWPWP